MSANKIQTFQSFNGHWAESPFFNLEEDYVSIFINLLVIFTSISSHLNYVLNNQRNRKTDRV